jgi:hypothetical protein
VTSGSLIAVAEFCPDWATGPLIVTDLSGRVVTDIHVGRHVLSPAGPAGHLATQ